MTSTTSSTNEPRKKWHKSHTVDLSNLRDSDDSESSHDTHAVRHDSSDAPDAPHTHKNSRKSKLWGNRISSLLPSIISPSSDSSSSTSAPAPTPAPAMASTTTTTTTTAPAPAPATAPATAAATAAAPPAPTIPAPTIPPPTVPPPTIPAPAPPASAPISRKVVESTTGQSSPTSTINDSVSTPSLQVTEPPTSLSDEFENTLGIQSQGNQETKQDSAPQLSLSEADFTPISMAVTSPEIKAIPPSPEMKRATLHKEPPPHLNSTVSPPESTSGDSQKGGNGKLQKQNPDTRRRSGSLQHIQDSLHNLKTRQSLPITEDRGRRSVSAQAPAANKRNSASGTRITSTPLNPQQPLSSQGDPSQSPTRGRIRRSWMPGGGRSRSNSIDVNSAANVAAWVISDDTRAEYNAAFLKNAEKVPELWNEGGDVYVHLYPRASGCGPSFKVPGFTINSSYIFNELIQSEREAPTPTGRSRARSFGGRDSLSVEDATRFVSPPSSPPPLPDAGYETKLFLPTAPPSGTGQLAAPGQGAQQEVERLIAIRNLFAFLTGQPLVATKLRPTNFHAFVQIADLLEEFGFTSMDGTTFGDAVDLSFSFYMDQLSLADCRHSREKTLEALILGERMRSLDLYNEAFAHATGKYSAIMDLRLPLFEQLSPHTRIGLERAHLDLVNRQHSVNVHLEQFEFPALFAGIANSTSIPELRHVRFKIWRQSFGRMRQFVLGYYKTTFGNWPPKASSKKNPFAESGLNRLVLKVLYSDMCSLYDLLVDRSDRTSRVMDEVPAITENADKMLNSALRNVMSEFDRSKPPVLPPIPYDCPQLPTPTSVHEPYNSLSAKDQAKFDKRIKEHELILILNKAYNYDTNSLKFPFLDQFKEFEIREGRGKGAQDLVDQRIGYWLFLYVVIQSLPVLVVDAPGMSFTEGVEYFLCQPPMGNPPWSGDKQVRKMWYEVAGGGGLVELSTDAVLFSIEATYHRSHCWLAAKQWEGHTGNEMLPPPPTEPALSPLQPPRSVFSTADDFVASPSTLGVPGTPSPPLGGPQVALRPRTHSPGGSRANQAYRSSMALGLEPVPLEPPQINQFPDRRSSLGIRGPSPFGSRSSSMGNMAALGTRGFEPETPPPEAATSGATFDDILGEEAAKPTPAAKKKGRFF